MSPRISNIPKLTSLFLQDANVRRIAVGIGSGIDISELRQIASSNNDVLQVYGYSQLIPKLEFIMNLACGNQYPGWLTRTNGKT